MTPSTADVLAARQRHFLASTVHYYREPLHLVRGQGVHVYDDAGREYLDCIGGIVCISAGHNHPRIKALVRQMLDDDELQHVSTLYLNRRPAELARELAAEAPAGIDRAFFTNSGSEANEAALLAARQATGETFVVNLRHSYHGGTAGTLAQCGLHTWRFRAQPAAAAASALEPYCYRCPFQQHPSSCQLECAQNIETTIQTATNGRIAAFIAEPVLGVGGFIAPPRDYFIEAARIVRAYGGKYISDEVQTGVGRCGGSFFATRDLGIDADAITMAKGLGNGAAIGAALMRQELSDALAGKLLFNTFGSDPYQTAQAKLVVDIVREEGLIENARTMGARLIDGLRTIMARRRLIGDVRGRGLLVGIELVKDQKTKEHAVAETAELMECCREKGVLVGKGGLRGNVVRIAPPLTINPAQCDQLLTAIDESLLAVERRLAS
jgi:4-aminobutyrate aminotransferase-like enzyme